MVSVSYRGVTDVEERILKHALKLLKLLKLLKRRHMHEARPVVAFYQSGTYIHKPPNHLIAYVSTRMRKNIAHAGVLDSNMVLVVR